MKRKFLIGIVLFTTTFLEAQEHSLENIFGAKIGVVGVWVNYEKALSDFFTINSEIGYEGGFLKGTGNNDFDYLFTAYLSIEPRFYYNFERRITKEKNVKNNSANYFSAELFFIPDWLSSSNRNGVSVVKGIGLVPKYGLRRQLTKKLNFEFAFGAGYFWGAHNQNQPVFVLDLRLTYAFLNRN